jgi:hypothetical protein
MTMKGALLVAGGSCLNQSHCSIHGSESTPKKERIWPAKLLEVPKEYDVDVTEGVVAHDIGPLVVVDARQDLNNRLKQVDVNHRNLVYHQHVHLVQRINLPMIHAREVECRLHVPAKLKSIV